MILLAISNGLKTGIFIVAIIIVFYLFLIRPQSQRAKAEENYRKGLQKGDRVMTTGGIHATVVSVTGNQATIEVAKDTRIRVQLATLSPIPQPKNGERKTEN